MKYLWILLFPIIVLAQVEKKVTVRVGGGLNTRSSDFDIKPEECRQAHNVDFSRNIGSISKRFGYYKTSALGSGYDSLFGLFGMYLSDGTKRLVFAADSAGVGYGGLYVGSSSLGRVDTLTTKIAKYWSPQGATSFSMFDDRLYVTNSVHKGVVWDGITTRSYPLHAPSEPQVYPIGPYSGTYVLNGEYRYVVGMKRWDAGVSDAGAYQTYLTPPIRVSAGRVLLTGLALPNADSALDRIDSAWVYIWRSRANPGRLDSSDIAHVIAHDTPSVRLYSALSDTLVVIDSISDSILYADAGTRYPRRLIDDTAFGGVYAMVDSFGTVTSKASAPALISRTYKVYTADTMTKYKRAGIFGGFPTSSDTLGVSYVVTYYDTIAAMESDTSRSLTIFNDTVDANGNMWSVNLSLPRIPSQMAGVHRRIYKSYLMEGGRDTIDNGERVSVFVNGIGSPCDDAEDWVQARNAEFGWSKYYSRCFDHQVDRDFEEDSGVVYARTLNSEEPIATPYFLVGVVKSSDTSFVDSTRYDSVATSQTYNYNNPASMLENVFSYGGRMWGTRGSDIYWSEADTSSRWGVFNSVSVGTDDGDVITAAWPTRRAIRVFKNKSSYNVYQDANLNWNLNEVSSNVGCIASRSHISGSRGHYYLSIEGFIRETEGQYLERTSNAELISSKLDNFDKLPMATLSGAYGTYIDGKCLWTIGDTTYVYDEKADAWSTWGFKIGGSTLYGAGSSVAFMPGDSLYFYQPNKKSIYVYGQNGYDTTWTNPFGSPSYQSITMEWKSAPFLLSSEQKILNTVGTWTSGSGVGMYGLIYDDADSSLTGSTFKFADSANNRYYKGAVQSARPSMSYHFWIRYGSWLPYSLNAFDLFYYNAGEKETR